MDNLSSRRSVECVVKDDKSFALKHLPLTSGSLGELNILRTLQGHPNIIKLVSDHLSNQHLVVCMEYHERTLLDIVLQYEDGMPLSRIKRIFSQLLSALHHVHTSGYVHHDIKLDNILVGADDRIYLIDFGFAKAYTSGQHSLRNNGGTLHYAAPEIWLKRACEGPEADIWALGVCLFLMVTSCFPFGGTTASEIWKEIKRGGLWKNEILKQEPMLYDLLTQMLAWDIRWRIRLSEIPQHPWMMPSRGFGASRSDPPSDHRAIPAGFPDTRRRSRSHADEPSTSSAVPVKPKSRSIIKRIFNHRGQERG